MKEESHWGIIYCPKYGFIRGDRERRRRIERALKAHHVDYDWVTSEHKHQVERVFHIMVRDGYRTIVIIGGDSALNDAVNVLMGEERQVRDRVSLGVIPNGVMNEFAGFWDLSEDSLDKNIEWLKQRRVRRIDVGCMRYHNLEGMACHRYFLNCVNIGLVATMMEQRNRARRFLVSRPLSFMASFALLLSRRFDYRMHFKINGEDIDRRVMTVCVGNATGYGMTPHAVPYNGELDVSVICQPVTKQLLEGMYLFSRNRILNSGSVYPYRTKIVEVRRIRGAQVAVDGRLMRTPSGPFRITVEQEVVNFIVPGT